MTMPSISCKFLLSMCLVLFLVGGCEERQEPAPPPEPPAVRKRVVVPQPPAIQVVKPGDIGPAAPVVKEASPKPEAPKVPTPKVVEVKPPVEEKAPAPKVAEVKPPAKEKTFTLEATMEPKKAVEETDKGTEIVAKAGSKALSPSETPRAEAFTINLASFKPRERADQYVKELKKLGIDAYVWEVDLAEKGKWHRVAVGRFPTLKEAKDYKEELKKKGISGTFITKTAESS